MSYEFTNKFIINYYIFFIVVLLLFISYFAFVNRNTFLGIIKKTDKKSVVILFIIFCLGCYLRVFFTPHKHYEYFDGFEHVNIAENLMYHGKFAWCIKGDNENCDVYEINRYSPGHHFLLAIFMRIFGDSEGVAFNFSAVIGSISIFLVFFLSLIIFNDRGVSLWCSLLFSLLPLHIKYSGSSNLEITSTFFILLTLIISFRCIEKYNIRLILLLCLVLLYTLQIRPENILLLFLIPMLFVVFDKRLIKRIYNELKDRIIFILIVLSIPYVIQMKRHLTMEFKGTKAYGQAFISAIDNLKSDIYSNLIFWFDPRNNPLYLILAFIGFIILFKKGKKIFLYFIIWITVLISGFSLYEYGEFMFADRYTLYPYIGIILAAGYGLRVLTKTIRKRYIRLISYSLLMLILLSSNIYILKGILKIDNEDGYQYHHYKEHEFVLGMKDRIPDDVYVISCNPSIIISSLHKRSIRKEIFVDMEKDMDRVILFKDIWWHRSSRIRELSEFEEYLRERYKFEVMEKLNLGDITYYFYSLRKKGILLF